ncbi:nuclease-related [Holotrichia oblita]|uniref:Nuclease-related n=1 Tax=Holotrichia oblita TaxID=644536 RepID=A0ACB9TZ21_HOLOL|nr:nuclease-related [Holotrichia oblita]
MGRRYYCDYCDKTFIDDLDARKKHLSSSHHIKLRKLHYETCRDLRSILTEESAKLPCRRFMRTGSCQFTGNCKYTHYTPEELWNIKQQIEYEEYEKRRAQLQVPELPSLESWLENYNKLHNKQEENDGADCFWSYPDVLESRTDLPPSVRKFQPEHFVDDNFEEWGA